MPIVHSKPWLTEADHRALAGVLASGMLAQGKAVRLLEAEGARTLGLRHAAATASGTAALMLVLQGLGLAPGAEVVVPTYVCEHVWQAVTAVGATPVLCDVGPDWVMTPESVAAVRTPRTAAVIVVHLFGIPCDMPAFSLLGLPLIEDLAQAWGATSGERAAGAYGLAAFVSTHATKCFTTGEGGLALTDDEGLATRMHAARDHEGLVPPFLFSPMSDVQASLGLSQMSQYPAFLTRRRHLADRYFAALADCDLTLPAAVRDRSIFFRFPVRSTRDDFDGARAHFATRGIHVRRGVDALLHRRLGLPGDRFPHAERAFASTVSLPLYPALTDDEQARVVDASRAYWCPA